MSKLPTGENPQIFVNGEQEEQADSATAAEEQASPVGPEEEVDNKVQARMQSVFHQVRSQIRPQVDTRTASSSILALMQKLKDREGRPEQEEDESRPKETEPEESKVKMDMTQEELCEAFGKKLETTRNTLRYEIDSLISQVRAESQAYTEQAIKDLECRMTSKQTHRRPSQQGKQVLDKKQQPSASSSLTSSRGRVLTRTMTTIIPKTCAPAVGGLQAKSESMPLRRSETSVPSLPGKRLQQARRPVLPSAQPAQYSSVKNRLGRSSTGN